VRVGFVTDPEALASVDEVNFAYTEAADPRMWRAIRVIAETPLDVDAA
jgi:hypothetical protein